MDNLSVLPEYWKKEDKQRDKLAKPVKDEREFARILRSLFENARDAQKADAEKWKKYGKWYRGSQWEKIFEPWRAQLVINACFATIETQLPVLAEVDPRMTIMPVEGGDEETASGLDDIFKYNTSKYFWDLEMIMAQKTSLKLGTAILKAGWNPDLGLEGDVDIVRIAPYNFFPDPTANTLDECRYVFEAKVMTLAEVKRLHPKKGKKVEEYATEGGPKDDVKDLKDADETRVFNTGTPGDETNYIQGILPEELEVGKYDATGIKDMLTKVLYIECWLTDDTMVELSDSDGKPVMGDDGKPEKSKAYPGGRHICFVGDVILTDEPNPFSHGRLPYVVLCNYPDDEGFWGTSEIENIKDLQKLLNKTESQITDNATVMGNPNWIVDDNSGVMTDTISNQPGKAIKKRQGTEVRRDAPPELPTYLTDQHDKALGDIEYITGIHDVLQGERPEGLRTYSAIRQVLEVGERRLRLKIQFQLAALRMLARLVAANYMQFYDTERWERILGEERVKDIIASRKKAKLNTKEEKDEDKTVSGELSFNLEEIYEMYDFLSETEAMTRNTRELMKEQMKDLFQLGAIDQQALLESWQIEGWEDIIARMTGAQQAAEAGQPPPPPEGELPPMPAEAAPPELPPEMLAQLMGGGGEMTAPTGPPAMPMPMPGVPAGGMPPEMTPVPTQQIPPEILQLLAQLPPELQQLPPEVLMQLLMQMMSGGGAPPAGMPPEGMPGMPTPPLAPPM